MTNPYIILGIKENASREEIREALKNKIDEYCGLDENLKDENGMYYKEIFYEAANQLLDDEERNKIDMEIKINKNGHSLAPVNNLVINNITDIDNDYVISKLSFKGGNPFKKKFDRVKANNLHFLFGRDNSVLIAQEIDVLSCYYLSELFTGQRLTYSYDKLVQCPWYKNDVFKLISTTDTYRLLGSKVIPIEIIDSKGKVAKDDLITLKKFLVKLCADNPQILEKVFKK